MTINHQPPHPDFNDIIVISGLPRSGTSLMMQMLAAGGMQTVTDEIRTPDRDNPRGYYEFEKVKKLDSDSSWLSQCGGKAIKIISWLLYDLPQEHHYRILFMERDIKEVLRSQQAMLQRLEKQGSGLPDHAMAEKFNIHLAQVKEWLAGQDRIRVLYISYNDLVSEPMPSLNEVNSFLGTQLDVTLMAKVVDSRLYRQRT